MHLRRASVIMIAMRSASASTPAGTAVAGQSCAAEAGPLPYTLRSKWKKGRDSWLLRFELPLERRYLGEDLSLPTCLKVLYPNGTDEKTGEPKPLEKSYSPVSHPSADGFVDLLVKAYPPRPGGGVGAYLCNMQVGDTVLASVKSKRMMHGDPAVLGRWSHIGLVAGGTGIAPVLQVARVVLEEEGEPRTRVHLLSINRHEEDILMRDDIDAMVAAHPGRFAVTYSLTGQPPPGWAGATGRGDVALASTALPPPSGDGKTQILVCGTDGFVATWGGPVGRAPKKPWPHGSKGGKVQGPLTGLLAEAGFDASEVFKY